MWQWLKRLFRVSLPRDRVSYAAQVGQYVHYTATHRGCKGCRSAVQQTVVVDREGLKQSEYVLWLN